MSWYPTGDHCPQCGSPTLRTKPRKAPGGFEPSKERCTSCDWSSAPKARDDQGGGGGSD